jgi:hypothetical protein
MIQRVQHILISVFLLAMMVGSNWVYNGCFNDNVNTPVMKVLATFDDWTERKMTLVSCFLLAKHVNSSMIGYRVDSEICLLCGYNTPEIFCDYGKYGRATNVNCSESNTHGEDSAPSNDDSTMKPMQVFTYDRNQVEDLCDESYPYDCDLVAERIPGQIVISALLQRTVGDPLWPWKDMNYYLDCPVLFKETLSDHQAQLDTPATTVHSTIPETLLPQFTLNSTIYVKYWIQQHAQDTFTMYSVKDVAVWSNETLTDSYRDNYCFAFWPYQCDELMKREDIVGPYLRNKTGIIFGSQKPWLEASLLRDAKAAHIATIEYFPVVVKNVPAWSAMQPTQMASLYLAGNFPQVDFIFSLSSFEHTGLGRYGDKLDPDGDLKAMSMAHCLLKDDGILFLSLPIGLDLVFFNMHRIYGRYRLPLLLAGWEAIDVIGKLYLDDPAMYQLEMSILVLRKKKKES